MNAITHKLLRATKTTAFLCILFIGQHLIAQQVEQDLSEFELALSTYRNEGCTFLLTPLPIPPSCNGAGDGQACIEAPPGGVDAYTYIWVGYPDTDTCLEGVPAGTYTCIVTEIATGISCGVDVSVIEPAPLTVFNMQATPPSCFGECDGSANPIVIGGNGGNQFAYDSGENSQSATMLCNPFQLLISDQNGCSIDTSFTFTNEPLPIQIEAVIDSLVCAGDVMASIDIIVSEGTPFYTYAWEGPDGFTSDEEDINGLSAGLYELTVTDLNNCTAFDSFEILNPDSIELSASITDILCFGDNTGAIDLSTSGGEGGYEYAWTGPDMFTSNQEDINDLFAGIYDLTVTDAVDCEINASFEVVQDAQLLITADTTHISCFGEDNGAIDVSFDQDCSSCSFAWQGPNGFSSNQEDLTDLPPGEYTLTVTYNTNCQEQSVYQILEPEEIILTSADTQVSCFGANDGSIDLTVSGGIPNLTFNWTGPNGFTANSEDISDLYFGTYDLLVTDANLCQQSYSTQLIQPEQYTISSAVVDVFCANELTGSISLDVSGSVPQYSYTWTGPDGYTSSVEDISGLDNGDYSVLISDQAGCDTTLTFTVDEPDSILIDDVVLTMPLCAGNETGAIDISVSGGIPALEFLWTGPDSYSSANEDIDQLAAGTYSLLITDANGCGTGTDIVLTEPDSLDVQMTITDLTCFEDGLGSIDLDIDGGTMAYTVSWTGPNSYTSIQEDISGLQAGLYTAEVTDANMCVTTSQGLVNQPLEITLTEVLTHVDCFGDNTGEIELFITEGVPSYTVSWLGPNGYTSADQNISDLFAGTYTVQVQDANGCTKSGSFDILENNQLTLTENLTNLLCHENQAGEIDITVNGGSPSYFYTWTGPNGFSSISEDLTGLEAGTYDLLLTDSLSCEVSASYDLTEPDSISVVAIVQQISCFNTMSGAIDISVSGGTGSYTYSWEGPLGYASNDEDISDLGNGLYTITVTDENMCENISTFEIIEPNEIIVTVAVTQPTCGDANGIVQVSAIGGTIATDYQYELFDQNNVLVSDSSYTEDLLAGTYLISVTDDNGCNQGVFFSVNSDTGSVIAFVTDESCEGAQNGSIDITTIGLTGAVTAQWSGPNGYTNTAYDINNLEAGSYTVQVIDELGCTISEMYEVFSPGDIQISANLIRESCDDAEDGAIDITLIGGSSPFNFDWTGPNGFSSIGQDITGLEAGMYFLTVTDNNLCTADSVFEVLVGDDFIVTGVTSMTACADAADGAIDVTVTPDPGMLSYSWTGPNGFSSSQEDIENLEPGEYVITVQSSLLCSVTESFDVLAPDPLVISTSTVASSCGEENGEVIITVTGGTVTTDYTYEVLNLATNTVLGNSSIQTGLGAGAYLVHVSDDNNCTSSLQFSISDETGVITAAVIDETCAGTQDGAINIDISGASLPFTVSWTGPNGYASASEDISNLMAGDYTVTVTDAASCITTETYTVSAGILLDVSALLIQIDCFASGNGAISITHNNGQEPFTHFWTGPNGYTSANQNIANLEAGTYTLQYSDALGCSGSAQYTIVEPNEIEVMETLTHASCFGEFGGAISLDVSGGTGLFSYLWTGPNGFTSTFEDINGLEGGTYTVSISDVSNCSVNMTYEVLQPEAIIVTVLQQLNATCNQTDGLIEVQASNGAAPYTYSWTNSANATISSAQLIDELPPDVYTVRVEDGNDCFVEIDIEIFNEEIDLSGVVTGVSCYGDVDGEIDLIITGVPNDPYTINWTGPNGYTADTEDITSLVPGAYSVTLNDAAGCLYGEAFVVTEPDTLIVANGLATNLTCHDSNDGQIDLSVTGGTPDYDFMWTGPSGFTSITEDLEDLSAGTYDVIIIDENDCDAVFNISLDAPEAITIQDDVQQPICFGVDNGTISLNVAGGSGGFEYTWTGPDGFTSIQQNLVSLESGTYEVLVTDDNNCSVTASYDIDGTQAIDNQVIITDITCFGEANGAIESDISGGTLDYILSWTGPDSFVSNSDDIQDLIAGQYILSITDANGCQRIDSIDVVEPDLFEVASFTQTNQSCAGQSQGALDITMAGGTMDFIYAWTGPDGFTSTQEDLNNLIAGEYTVMVTDENECVAQEIFDIIEPSAIEINLEGSVDAQCSSSADGAIDISASGGNPNYTYAWTGPDGYSAMTEDIINLYPGIYTISITDDNMCSVQESFSIGALLGLTADAGSYEPVCEGDFVIFDGSDSQGANDFSWTNLQGDLLSTEIVFTTLVNANSSTFILTASDGMCFDTDTVTLSTFPIPEPDAGDDITAFFEEVVTLGGEPTYDGVATYSWTPETELDSPSLANPELTVTQNTNFTVEVTDVNGCTGVDFIQVMLIPNLIVPDGFSPNGDGFNDLWVFGNSNRFPLITVEIFNRWGDKIYSSGGELFSWDGKYEDVDVPVGTYYYAIELNDPLFPDPITGPLTIFR